ncbi:MAG: hypothetical protein HOG55_10775 [Anaerolineae bacterium]|jgi:hypothetical protein|uniref:Uncharacterized protein n=1 Tax=Candidatus Desulfolinea nitratireducens TaxID=2841698 RepID=A0A8J6TFT4_9CHLR|nr:hypothetical protein [Candidatus Desulfolinea nitratireducens]MBT6061665.1 hypothetical protein [Anaerolineae bacterium]
MTKLIIYLREEEFSALSNLAQREYRVIKAQASLIIRIELERLGLLHQKDPKSTTPVPLTERPPNLGD